MSKYLGEPVTLKPRSKHILLDTDTLLHRAANSIQTNHFRVIGEKESFKGKKPLWAHYKELGKEKDELEIEEFVFHVGDPADAEKNLYFEVTNAIKQHWVKDYTLFIEGEGNFREDAATMVKYKGNRNGPKLQMFSQIRDFLLNQWGDNVVISEGQETDDTISITGWSGYNAARTMRDRNQAPHVLGYVDKDLNQIAGYHWNYLKPEDPVTWMNDLEGWRWFCWQILLGDSTDNILGLTKWSKEISAHYGVRKIATVGEVGCWKLLEGYDTKMDLTQRVIDIYKHVYGIGSFKLETWDGEAKDVDWKYILNENAILLRMRQFKDEMYVFTEDAKKQGCIV